jgi:hypothetical protein
MAKVVEEAMAAKEAVDEATVAKAAKVVMVKTVVDEAATKMTADKAVAVTTDQGVAWTKVMARSVCSGSSPTPAVGTKRAAASGGSTPPSK